ncbi:MAG: phosphate/phosphite/phosphonate ABC transporter substrate-binding protein [Deltaproteobacteria bacterium]|nr:MAG: phosphate/phosphite/phosphonate ABC transporter substrate-binding protein [Deltaproteobacteria bacterium]
MKSKNLISSLILVALVVMASCGKDSDAVVIDFDKTIAVDRPKSDVSQNVSLNVAVAAMISPKETFSYYKDLLDYIGAKMNRKVRLIQRKTYGEVNELFQKGQIDLAFICSGPYAVDKETYGFEALATPIVREKPFYQSYLIVNKTSTYQNFMDLKGKVFAFTDPDSNTGALVPRYWLSKMGQTPESFFESFTYTYSHDNSIMAVARALVDGATVDGHKWEYFQSKNPIYSSRTRVLKKSEPFGSPPLVASIALSTQNKEQIRQFVYTMHLDPEGKKILDKLMIDRFVPSEEEWYEPIRQMKYTLMQSGNPAHATQ